MEIEEKQKKKKWPIERMSLKFMGLHSADILSLPLYNG